MIRLVALIITCSWAGAAHAQGVIDPENKLAWGENIGFLNWRDANDATDGVRLRGDILAGFIWCENIGWVSVGDGTPAAGSQYSNTDGADYGVNVSGTGDLSGLAWSENTGWISFDAGALASPANPARIDFNDTRLRGLAWSPNVGWVNLDDADIYVGLLCACDRDLDGTIDINDLLQYLALWFEGELAADEDGDGVVGINDLLSFLACWFAAPACL